MKSIPSKLDPQLTFLNHGVSQLGFVVEDLETTVQNYYHAFGIGNWHFYHYKSPMLKEMNYLGKPVEYGMHIALSYFGPMRVELIQPDFGPTIYADFIAKHGYGLQHFGIVVEDIETELNLARAAGYSVVMDGSGFGLDGDGKYAYLDTEDTLGATFELIQRPKRRHQPLKIFAPEN